MDQDGERPRDPSRNRVSPEQPYQMTRTPEELERFIEENGLRAETSILDEDEAYIQADLMMQRTDKTRDMESFLHSQNMLINHKKYRCALACYADPDSRSADIRHCVDRCQKGEDRFNAFVSRVFEVRHSEFQACMQAKQKASLYEIITCYENLFRSFDSMKSQIATEQGYYQP